MIQILLSPKESILFFLIVILASLSTLECSLNADKLSLVQSDGLNGSETVKTKPIHSGIALQGSDHSVRSSLPIVKRAILALLSSFLVTSKQGAGTSLPSPLVQKFS